MANRYWVGGTANWDGTAGTKWSLTSGGAGGETVPADVDDVFFDANSGAGTTTIATNTANCQNLNFTGFTGTLAGSGVILNVYGNFTLSTGMTFTFSEGIVLRATTAKTVTTNGKSIPASIDFNGLAGTWTLQDALVCTNVIYLVRGTFDANNFNVTATRFSTDLTNTRVLTMGSGTWNLTTTATSNAWEILQSSGLTINANTSTIKISGSTTNIRTFMGGGLTYYNLWFSNATAAGQMNVTGANTFNDIQAGVEGNAQTIRFTAATTTTVTTFTVSGAASNLITIGSITNASHTLTKAGGGTISRNFLSISYSTATPASTWSTASSTDGGNNSGWTFTIAAVSNMFLMM